MTNTHQSVEMIPVCLVDVLNPRTRNKKQHEAIVENIRSVGLKRPIKVSRRTLKDGSFRYDLICGQGRLLIRPCEVLSRVANVTILEVANNALRVLLQHRHVIIGSLA